MDIRLDEKKFHYQNTVLVWEGFCQLHRQLYDLTCEEYLILLESDIDRLEAMLPLKEEIIQRIGELETERSELIEKLNGSGLYGIDIRKAGDLLTCFEGLDRAAP